MPFPVSLTRKAVVASFLILALSGLSTAQGLEPIVLITEPIDQFSRRDNGEPASPHLHYRGGFVVTAEDDRFGGLSGLTLSEDGTRLLSVSDTAYILSAKILYEGNKPVGLASSKMGRLTGPEGAIFSEKEEADSEAIMHLGSDEYVVSFERENRFLRYTGTPETGFTAHAMPTPKGMKLLRANKGVEALALIPAPSEFAGGMIAFAENPPGKSEWHAGWIIHEGINHRIAIEQQDGYSLTDAAFLPSGDLLVLERYFARPFTLKCRIRRFAADRLKPGALLEGEIILEADTSAEIDNMEAIAVHQNDDGETIVTLMSDDNFNPFQDTILLQFAFIED